MRREVLLIAEMIEAATQAQSLVAGRDLADLEHDRQRRDDRIVHGYWSIDLEILHTTATDLLPAFLARLREVLAEVEADDG